MGDDKPRRNLFLASAAIALAAWLNLPANSIVQRILGSPSGFEIIAWKVWVAVVAVLAYLTVRYYFAAWRNEWHAAKNAFIVDRNSLWQARVGSHVKAYSETGRESDVLPNMHHVVTEARPANLANDARPIFVLLQSWTANSDQAGGEIQLNVNWRGGTTTSNARYDIPSKYQRWHNIQAALHVTLWSGHFTELTVPAILWAVAVWITVCRLVQSIPSELPPYIGSS